MKSNLGPKQGLKRMFDCADAMSKPQVSKVELSCTNIYFSTATYDVAFNLDLATCTYM